MKNTDLKGFLSTVDTKVLKQWILNYAKENPNFAKGMIEALNPKSIKDTALKNYPKLIRAAFDNHPMKFGNRYRGYDYEGFDAEDVRVDLEKVLKDVGYFLNHKNLKAAVHICKCMIEIIPDEWDEQFDYEGDVQVMYDEAIDYLESMLKENLLSSEEKQDLFAWYAEESKNLEKHEYVGLNTDLSVLQHYFLSSEEMTKANLKLIDKKIEASESDYDKEMLIMQKLEILKDVGMLVEREAVIQGHLKYVNVRKLELKKLLENQAYSQAIQLIHKGIEIAKKEGHSGTVSDWKDALLKIYQAQGNHHKTLILAEDLFYTGREREKYYRILKSETPTEHWPKTVNRIINKIPDGRGYFGFDQLKAKILIEHQKWDLLFKQCKTSNEITHFEEYEKYLRPLFDDELYRLYLMYIEREATITDQKSYENVARLLKRLKTFPDGKEKVKALVAEYSEVYKRRKNMMKELEGV